MKRLLLFGLLCVGFGAAQTTVSPPPSEPVLKNSGSPTYPPLAKVARVSGQVKLEFVVNGVGDVVSVMVVSGPPMLAPAAVDAVNSWKFRMPKRASLEDMHLETIFDYVLGDGSPAIQLPVVFDSFHRVTLTTEPTTITGVSTSTSCPDFKKLKPLGSDENAAFVELSRASCYI